MPERSSPALKPRFLGASRRCLDAAANAIDVPSEHKQTVYRIRSRGTSFRRSPGTILPAETGEDIVEKARQIGDQLDLKFGVDVGQG